MMMMMMNDHKYSNWWHCFSVLSWRAIDNVIKSKTHQGEFFIRVSCFTMYRYHLAFFFLLLVCLLQKVQSRSKVHRRHRCVDDCSKSLCGEEVCSKCTSQDDRDKAEDEMPTNQELGMICMTSLLSYSTIYNSPLPCTFLM